MKKVKIFFVFIIIIILLTIFLFTQTVNQKVNKGIVEINNIKIEVEIADTPELHAMGLSNKKSLASNQGMLFVFPDYKIRNFWMKDMNFSIDALWILDDKIVGIEKNIPLTKNNEIKQFKSSTPVNYVLEVSAGFIDKNNIVIGNNVKINYEN